MFSPWRETEVARNVASPRGIVRCKPRNVVFLKLIILHLQQSLGLQRFVVKGDKGGVTVQEVGGTEGKEAFVVVVVV